MLVCTSRPQRGKKSIIYGIYEFEKVITLLLNTEIFQTKIGTRVHTQTHTYTHTLTHTHTEIHISAKIFDSLFFHTCKFIQNILSYSTILGNFLSLV